MNNFFIEWLNNQHYEDETNRLFLEGYTCYKGEAFRAAFLFTFLGFQSMIKEKVLLSATPDGYTEENWFQIKRGIGNDDETWEEKIQTLIKNKRKSPFKLSEDLYEQYFYWKNRRNDCAHAKGNYISYSHVEAFWLFIKSNSHKFNVNGGKNYIFSELEEHFDIHITPSGSDISPILVKIPFAVEKNDYFEIFDKMRGITLRDKSPTLNKDLSLMWKKTFNYTDLQESLVKYLIKEEHSSLLLSIFRAEPNLVKFFINETDFSRKLWINKLSISIDYYIFIEMLRNSLIPSDQLEEACTKIINTIESHVFGIDYWFIEKEISEIDFIILKEAGFFNVLYKMAFLERRIVTNFSWANSNKDLIISYINRYGLDEVSVEAINSSFLTTYNPRQLNSHILDYYKKNKDKWHEHIEIIDKMVDEPLPKALVINE